MTAKKILFFLVTLVIISLQFQCQSKLYYTKDSSNGYSDEKLGDELYKVSVFSKDFKLEERMKEIFLLRSAEIAKENDYPYFYTVNKLEYLNEFKKQAKPYGFFKYHAGFYENIKMEGYLKLLKTADNPQVPYPIQSTDKIYRRNYYLIQEKVDAFGSTTATNQVIITNQVTVTNQVIVIITNQVLVPATNQ